MTMTYEKSISPFAPSGGMPGNPSVHKPNFPGARTIREGRQMYVGDYQYVTIHTTDTTWSVFAGTILVVDGPKPEFTDNREMYAAAFALATAHVATPFLPSYCKHCGSSRVRRYQVTPPPPKGEMATVQRGYICKRCRMFTPLI